MDRMYIKNAIEQLEREKASHEEKFGRNPVHANCIPNFEVAVGKLRKELEKFEEVIPPDTKYPTV